MMDWIVSIRTDFLTQVFSQVTRLGDESFIVIVLCIGYWAWNKRLFRDMAFVLMIGLMLTMAFKEVFLLERPAVEYLTHVSDVYGFPSGHTCTVLMFWFILAIQLKRDWFWWTTLAVVVAVGFSRVYLGVHYPRDIAGGFVLGALLVIAYEFLKNTVYWALFSRNKLLLCGIVLFSVGIYVGIFYESFRGLIAGYTGGMLGLTLGHYLEHRYCQFKVPSDYGVKLMTCAVGLVLFAFSRYTMGIALAGSKTTSAFFIKYFVTLLVIMFVIPLIISKIQSRISTRESVLST